MSSENSRINSDCFCSIINTHMSDFLSLGGNTKYEVLLTFVYIYPPLMKNPGAPMTNSIPLYII